MGWNRAQLFANRVTMGSFYPECCCLSTFGERHVCIFSIKRLGISLGAGALWQKRFLRLSVS